MTREEAILCLKGMKNYARDTFTEQTDWQTSLDMAIQALEQNPCNDTISRQAVDEIKELMTDINGDTVYAVRMSDIRQLPSVNPASNVSIQITEREKYGRFN